MSTIFECWNGLKVKEIGAVVLRGEKKVIESFRLEGSSVHPSGVQSPAQSKVSIELRLGCSGLCPIGFWKPQSVESVPPLWAMAAIATLSREDSFYFHFVSKLFLLFTLLRTAVKSLAPSLFVLDRGLFIFSNLFRLNKPQSLSLSL